jgi:EAL domain-containing protein (putative c-di-GMP-specific phosphodiesterase class I)
MAEPLGMQALAEGVETLEQADALRELHCPLAQGFLFGRPVPAPQLAGLLASSGDVNPRGPGRAPGSGGLTTD